MENVNSDSLFFRLLRQELWQLPAEDMSAFEKQEIDDALKTAKEQTVTALVANSIIRNNMSVGRQRLMYCLSYQAQTKKNNLLLNDVLKALADTLNGQDIHYVVFKGQIAGLNYANPMLRTPGDIDFYCAADDYDKAMDAIRNGLGITFDKRDFIDRHDSFAFNDVRCEMHYKMEVLGMGRHQRYYDRIMEENVCHRYDTVVIDDKEIRTLDATTNVLHIFKHLFNHLLVEGVGLRQCCDLAMAISRNKNDIDFDRLDRDLKAVGYYRAFLATTAMLVKYLGMEESCMPYHPGDVYYRWADRMIAEIMFGGNFGRSGRKHNSGSMSRSFETASIALRHCVKFFPLAPIDIAFLIPKRIGISLKKYLERLS